MELQNKRPTQILIVSKQSRQCSGELNTNFWTKELKQSLAGQKVIAMLELELFGSKFSQNLERENQNNVCYKVLLQCR